MKQATRDILRRIFLSGAILILALIFGCGMDCATFESWNPIQPRDFHKTGNGVWFRYLWYSGKYSDSEFAAMLDRISSHHLKYVYFHVLETNADGSLRWIHRQNARKITDAVHKQCPGAKVVAWVYIPSHKTDIKKQSVRANLVKTAGWLCQECGFDGVQWDYEFAPCGNAALVDLCKETKAALPDAYLSVASPMWYDGTLWGWNDQYFQEIAKQCNQIAVMGYDSHAWLPQQYIPQLAAQVKHVGADVRGTTCSVIIGVPTYEDVTPAHKVYAENLRTAIRALYKGLSENPDEAKRIEGIALFADYTTDSTEWNTFDQLWTFQNQVNGS